ncbi:MAG: YcxB family protein [Butyrivibrio sp.]|uniref:YcxB family protein n=1 Tax=Butyrivibrio sp. LB2008 TaxID=1408305 RepID=UPI00047CFADB|nr:YcxB family protein [Butyrivibrio sp. LB2008]MEE3494251.1 YcxB family protein [Butyrivibrio sp.]
MEYRYISDVKPKDLWLIAMIRTYRSLAGVINVVFTVAMIMLTIRFWGSSGAFIRTVLILASMLFPVFQPFAIYLRSIKQLETLPGRVELTFNDAGVHVSSEGKQEDIKWNKIANAIKQSNMIIVMSDSTHGYMLTNRILGDEKDEFYDFLCKKIRN